MLRLTAIAAFAVALAMTAGCDWLMSDQERFEKAQRLFERGEYGDASIQLKKLLQSTDDTPQARVLLGRVLLYMGQPGDAEAQFRKAGQAGVPVSEYAVELANTYLLQAKHDRIIEEFNDPGPGDAGTIARLNVVRGKAFLAKGQPDRAVEAFNAALEAVPGDPGARVGLALVEAARQRVDRAEARIDEVLNDHPDFDDALLVKGQLAARAGRHEQAEKAFERIGTGDGGRSETSALVELQAMVGVGEARYRRGDLDGAGQAVEALSQRFPGHPLTAYMKGLVDYARGEYEAAISGLTPLTQSGVAMPGIYFLTGASHYALDNLEQAQMFLSGAVERAPDDVNARRLLALTEMRLGQPDRAGEVVQSMAQAAGSGEMWRMLGGLSLRQGDFNTGIDYLERGSDSGDPAAAMDLAAAYIAGGRAESGLEVLNRLPDTFDGAQRRDMLEVLAYVNEGDLDAARTRVAALVKTDPEDYQVRSLAGSVYMAAGDWGRARTHYEKAHSVDPDNTGGRFNLARLAAAEGNTAAATNRLENILADSPGHPGAALLLARLQVQSERPDAAADVLEKALSANPDSDRLRVTLSRLYLVRDQIDKVEALAQAALERRPDQDFYVRTLVEARLRQGKTDQAESFLQQRIQANPEAVQPLIYLARVQSADGRHSDARRQLEQALALPGDEAAVRFEMARVDAAAGEYKRALATLNKVRAERPEAVAVHELEGDIYAAQGRFEQAQAAFARAADIEPTRARIGRLLQTQSKAGMAPAVERLERWVEQHPNDAEAMIMLAQHRQVSDGGEKAAPVYEKALAADPDNAVALNNLAWIYAEQGDKRALTLAGRAYELAPDSGGIVDTYGWVLSKFGRTDQAVTHLRRAVELEPDVPDIRFHLAAALHAAGKTPEARGILADLLGSSQPFNERREAEALYEKLR